MKIPARNRNAEGGGTAGIRPKNGLSNDARIRTAKETIHQTWTETTLNINSTVSFFIREEINMCSYYILISDTETAGMPFRGHRFASDFQDWLGL